MAWLYPSYHRHRVQPGQGLSRQPEKREVPPRARHLAFLRGSPTRRQPTTPPQDSLGWKFASRKARLQPPQGSDPLLCKHHLNHFVTKFLMRLSFLTCFVTCGVNVHFFCNYSLQRNVRPAAKSSASTPSTSAQATNRVPEQNEPAPAAATGPQPSTSGRRRPADTPARTSSRSKRPRTLEEVRKRCVDGVANLRPRRESGTRFLDPRTSLGGMCCFLHLVFVFFVYFTPGYVSRSCRA